jgi:xanthine dehydrogenase accessory factor
VTAQVLAAAAELSARGEPFVLATVVWRRAPSSGKPGSRAVITPDGEVHGWLGGACAEPVVVREALRALEEETPRLMFLGQPEDREGADREGVLFVPIACQSEGAMEIYVEPMVPAPHLVAIGRTPAVSALALMAAALGWRTVVVDEGGSPADHPGADLVVPVLDLEAAGVAEGSVVVVATQGHYDEDALERALATPAAYVGLVASRKRAEAVMGLLRDRGIAEEALSRVHAPAGIDLGPVTSEEIAVAILAEIVKLRAARELRANRSPATRRAEAVDPVCGMTVEPETSRYRAVADGVTYYLCSAGCQRTFEADPARFVQARA